MDITGKYVILNEMALSGQEREEKEIEKEKGNCNLIGGGTFGGKSFGYWYVISCGRKYSDRTGGGKGNEQTNIALNKTARASRYLEADGKNPARLQDWHLMEKG